MKYTAKIRRKLFFFNDTATTEIYTLSLHDALPIYLEDIPVTPIYFGLCWTSVILSIVLLSVGLWNASLSLSEKGFYAMALDRKSTRLNSSHANISYAVFCLK